jgi:hypothetical protein
MTTELAAEVRAKINEPDQPEKVVAWELIKKLQAKLEDLDEKFAELTNQNEPGQNPENLKSPRALRESKSSRVEVSEEQGKFINF